MERSAVESGTEWSPKAIPAPPPPPKPYNPISADAAGRIRELEEELKILAGDVAKLTRRVVELEKGERKKA